MNFNAFAALLEQFVDTSIARLSTGDSGMCFRYQLDLRELTGRVRLTQKLAHEAIDFCRTRGIEAEVDQYTGALLIAINLRTCLLNGRQALDFNTALAFARQFHGENL